MKLASLFSGGKDSVYAMHLAGKLHEISCLITIKSKNSESYMFHTPNIDITELQAEAMGLPLLAAATEGKKEDELKDLREAIKNAKNLFRIEGIVTGAIESVYQAARIQKICHELKLWCFSPLWKKNQIDLLNELLEEKFDIIISAVAAYPFDERWLGRKIDKKAVTELKEMQDKYHINPAGEGGEYESLVLNAPIFRKGIEIIISEKIYRNHSGIFRIREAR